MTIGIGSMDDPCYALYSSGGRLDPSHHFQWRNHLVRQSYLWTVHSVGSVVTPEFGEHRSSAVCAALQDVLPLRARARAVRTHEETTVKNRRFPPLGSDQRQREDWSGSEFGGSSAVSRNLIDCECYELVNGP
jgi:hypothetical protein